MRFKAKLSNEKLGVFQGVAATLEKIGPLGVVHLSDTSIQLCIRNDSGQGDDVLAFSALEQKELFHDWRIESQSGNCILLQLTLQNLLDALHSARNAPQCQLKLTKRNGQAALCLETRALEVDVIHDIPVTVMRASEYQYYCPPDVPQPQVQLELPMSRNLKTVIDRLKNISRYIYLHGEMTGALTLRAETDSLVIQTYFSNLRPRLDSLDESCEENRGTVKVDTKKLATVLSSYSLRFDSIIMCLIEGYSLVVHVILSPSNCGTLTFYLPVMSINDEDMWVEEEDRRDGGEDGRQ